MISWEVFAPPLDPPKAGGLPAQHAQQIAAQLWPAQPWLCLALMWEAYALTLPPEPDVVSVSTGVQSVGYAGPGGPFGLAMARAQLFRDMMGSLGSVPLEVGPQLQGWPFDWWQRDFEDAAP